MPAGSFFNFLSTRPFDLLPMAILIVSFLVPLSISSFLSPIKTNSGANGCRKLHAYLTLSYIHILPASPKHTGQDKQRSWSRWPAKEWTFSVVTILQGMYMPSANRCCCHGDSRLKAILVGRRHSLGENVVCTRTSRISADFFRAIHLAEFISEVARKKVNAISFTEWNHFE